MSLLGLLWLGANNALGTIVWMDVRSTAEADELPLAMDLDQRNSFNLWTTEHFEAEYEELMEKVQDILSRGKCDCKVFAGTVPAVTIAPLARGVGNSREEDDPFKVLKRTTYFDRYTYFLFGHDYARRSGNSLTFEQAYEIDSTIAEYNKIIKRIVAAYNRKGMDTEGPKVEYFIVDICDQLLRLAFKRNHGKSTYELPQEIIDLNKRLGSTVDTVYYTGDRTGRMSAGGVFSLDGVHPTALGHGLIASEFLKVFEKAKVPMVRGLDWNGNAASDSLYTSPISLMPELYDNTRLAELPLDLLRLP